MTWPSKHIILSKTGEMMGRGSVPGEVNEPDATAKLDRSQLHPTVAIESRTYTATQQYNKKRRG
jgi:hypothetical protein